jgi:protein-S-isoprenylcysteine O-methyltransferase Ste14
MINKIITLITLGAEILTTLALIISIAFPQKRIWPPGRQHSWGQYTLPIFFIISGAGVILVGILDWGGFIFSVRVRTGIGFPLWLFGNILAIWAIAALGIAPTSGEESSLVYRGPYRFSRNPQYAGFMLALIGWALITNSALAVIVSLVGIIPLLLVPFAEEPWLLEKHGSFYVEYKRTVPRFVAFKK